MLLSVTFDEMYPLISEKLALGGTVRFSPKGTSMLPTIRQGIDEISLTSFKGHLKKYDIAFYRRENGQFVLHRVIKKLSENSYVMRGDHQFESEYGITEKNIIAVADGFYRDKKFIKAGSLAFWFWAAPMPFIYRTKVHLRKIYSYLKGR